MPNQARFSGAKIALLCNGQLLTYLRDDKPSIPWPGMWDLPGGGREGDETPLETAARETREEFNLTLDPAWVVSTRRYAGEGMNGLDTWFLVAHVPTGTFEQVIFGDEGQRWEVIPVDAFLQMDGAVVHLQQRLRDFLQGG
jgi:8-oxo-dGTP diphosphatase